MFTSRSELHKRVMSIKLNVPIVFFYIDCEAKIIYAGNLETADTVRVIVTADNDCTRFISQAANNNDRPNRKTSPQTTLASSYIMNLKKEFYYVANKSK